MDSLLPNTSAVIQIVIPTCCTITAVTRFKSTNADLNHRFQWELLFASPYHFPKIIGGSPSSLSGVHGCPRMSTGFDQEAQQWKARGKPKSMAVSWARFFLHGFGRRNFWNKFHRAACTVGYSWLFHISAIACCSTTTLYSCFFFHFFLSKRLIVTAWSMSTIWTNSS